MDDGAYIFRNVVSEIKKMMRKFSLLGPKPNLTYEMFNTPCVANIKTNKQKTRSQFLQKQRADTEPPAGSNKHEVLHTSLTFCYNMYNSSNDAQISAKISWVGLICISEDTYCIGGW